MKNNDLTLQLKRYRKISKYETADMSRKHLGIKSMIITYSQDFDMWYKDIVL